MTAHAISAQLAGHAVRCSALQYAAVCCSVLHCVAVCCSALQCLAVCYRELQCVTVCYIMLQCFAVCCITLQCVVVHSCALQCVAVCCSALQMLQSTLTNRSNISGLHPSSMHSVQDLHRRNTLQHTATHYNTLQPTARYYHTPQHTVTHTHTTVAISVASTPPPCTVSKACEGARLQHSHPATYNPNACLHVFVRVCMHSISKCVRVWE